MSFNPEWTILPLSLPNLSPSCINMAVLPRCPVILGFSNMKCCNPPGSNLILSQLTKSPSLRSYQSFSLYSSLWGCHPCRCSPGTLLLSWWLEHQAVGAVLHPMPGAVGSSLTPSDTGHRLVLLPFCSSQLDQLWWELGHSVQPQQYFLSQPVAETHINQTPEAETMFIKTYTVINSLPVESCRSCQLRCVLGLSPQGCDVRYVTWYLSPGFLK